MIYKNIKEIVFYYKNSLGNIVFLLRKRCSNHFAFTVKYSDHNKQSSNIYTSENALPNQQHENEINIQPYFVLINKDGLFFLNFSLF